MCSFSFQTGVSFIELVEEFCCGVYSLGRSPAFPWVVVARLLSKIQNMPTAEFYGKLL